MSPSELEQIVDRRVKEALQKEKEKAPAASPKAPSDGEYLVGTDLGMKAVWRNGVWLETPHKDFQFHIGATVHYDAAFYSAGDAVQFNPGGVGELRDGMNMRRGRIRGEGKMWEIMSFLFELEFANGVRADDQVFSTPGPTDAHITLSQLPVIGNVRIGNQKEPFSIEHLNSYRYLEFMERSLLFDAFSPTPFNNGFSPGISIFNTALDERMTWAVGFFKNDRDLFGFGAGDGQYAVTGRATALLMYGCDGATLWHVGAAGSHRDPVDGTVQFRVRDSVRNAPFPLLNLLLNTGEVAGDSQNLLNLETAMVLGPTTIQAEYTASQLTSASVQGGPPLGDVFYQGCYVQVMYFLTGEVRPYNRATGTFDRVIPHEPFFFVPGPDGAVGGRGAWEVGARYAYLDLQDAGIRGGVLHDVTLGLSWYLNPNARIQWNFDVADRTQTGTPSNGAIYALGMRLAYDF